MRSPYIAYSLVELLVVLALTASLMAMLFPVFAQVREKGRATTCLSNLRQLGVAMAMYAQDADELYPSATDVLTRHSFSQPGNPYSDPIYQSLPLLTDVMRPYVKNGDIWRCPSDVGSPAPGEPGNHLPLGAKPSAFEAWGSSYDYNTDLALKQKLFATGGVLRGVKVGSGAITVMGDVDGAWHGDFDPSADDFRYNFLMGDGHVRRLTNDQRIEASFIQLESSD